jgi:hypothetical protein
MRFAGQLLPFLSHCGDYMHVVQLLSQYRSLLNILVSLSGMPLLGGDVATYEQRLHKIDAQAHLLGKPFRLKAVLQGMCGIALIGADLSQQQLSSRLPEL